MSPPPTAPDQQPAPAVPADAERELRRIVTALGDLGFALPGSIMRRVLRCGKPGCRCADDPDYLHGPYIQWSRAVKGKTVTKALTNEQLARYQTWFDNGHRLRELSHELNELSLDTIRTIEGWGR
jgi:hypothetical protein